MLTFETILRSSQKRLKRLLHNELRYYGYNVDSRNGFLYASGSVPVMLVAHLDTVHREPVRTICYSSNKMTIMSPEGIGGDDRAGVYMILQIIRGLKCHVLFCEDEEIGGVGAEAFASSGIQPDVNYIVEVDRRGSNDAVFYSCSNCDFTEFVCGFGFEEALGSFSDISVIAPRLGIAAVNISSGYYNEHTLHEYIDLSAVQNNVNRLCSMIRTNTERFEYVEGAGGFVRSRLQFLSPLQDSAYLRSPDGSLVEADYNFMVDRDGVLYEYVEEFGVACVLAGYTAYTRHGVPVRFNENEAVCVDVYE